MAAKRYKAVVDFTCPDGEAELKKCLAHEPYRSAEHKKGVVLVAPCRALLASWLANGAVEEVADDA